VSAPQKRDTLVLQELVSKDTVLANILDTNNLKKLVVDSFYQLRDSLVFIEQPMARMTLSADKYEMVKTKIISLQKETVANLVLEQQKMDKKSNHAILGLTSKSFSPMAALGGETGIDGKEVNRVMREVKQNLQGKKSQRIILNGVQLNPQLKQLDFRNFGIVTPVQDQGDYHPNCWAFAACGAYESAYQIANGHQSIKLCEQSILNCSDGVIDPVTGEGVAYKVLEWLVQINTDKLSPECNYKGRKVNCTEDDAPSDSPTGYWGLVAPDYRLTSIASTDQIKEALCRYGPVTTSLFYDKNWKDYRGGVVREVEASARLLHTVLIIGWNETLQAWLIKNSYGSGWGYNCPESGYKGNNTGYMWVAYGAGKIGMRTAFIVPDPKK